MSTRAAPGARTVHLMVLDKFIPRFIDFVAEHFDLAEHRFCLMGAARWEHGLTPAHPVEWVASADDHVRLVETLHSAERIVLHGLWSEAINRILYALPALARKSHWVIWGGDLYQAVPTEPSPGWLHQVALAIPIHPDEDTVHVSDSNFPTPLDCNWTAFLGSEYGEAHRVEMLAPLTLDAYPPTGGTP